MVMTATFVAIVACLCTGTIVHQISATSLGTPETL
jgi:hypothetical protein